MGRIRSIALTVSLTLALLAAEEPARTRGSRRAASTLESHGATGEDGGWDQAGREAEVNRPAGGHDEDI